MSRYIVTTGSHYDPMSYDEIIKPLQQMTDAQNEAADAYDTLDMQTQALANYISDADPQTKALYDSYVEKLGALQDQLWNNGYNANTRRQLAAARSGYARDITAIDAAIKRRQDVSKIYRDSRIKDPSLVQGADPSRDSLDKYLRNDTYGTDWYSYSGNKFQKEVMDDAKNRVEEWISADAYLSGQDPNLPGYLMQRIYEGFSSDDVYNAREIARALLKGADYEAIKNDKKYTEGAKILGDVLYSHIVSTGAADANLDPAEMERLLNYGADGLSAAIGKRKITNLNDYAWQYENDPSKNGSRSGSGSGKDQKLPGTYSLGSTIVETGSSKNTAKLEKFLGKKTAYGAYTEGNTHTIAIPGDDGTGTTSKTFRNANEATGYIYHTDERDRILNSGLDIALGNDKKNETDQYKVVKLTDKYRAALANHKLTINGEPIELSDDADCAVIVKTPEGEKLSANMTLEFNHVRKNWLKHIDDIKKANPGLDIDKFAMSPDEERKLREKIHADPRINWRDLERVAQLQTKAWTVANATLANHQTPAILKDVEDLIVTTYNNAGPNDKASRLAVYKVNDDGTVQSKGVDGGIDKLAPKDSSGKTKDGWLRGVELTPENIKNGQITLLTENGRFVCSDDYLGSEFKNALKSNVPGTAFNLAEVVDQVMQPIDDPQAALLGEGTQRETEWRAMMERLFVNPSADRNTLADYGLVGPDNRVLTPSQIVRSDKALEALYRLAVDYISLKAGFIRDEDATNRYQTIPTTNANPTQYTGYYYYPEPNQP